MTQDRLSATLAAARTGDEYAFDTLWREANPALVRFLRVMVGERAHEVAAHVWAALTHRLGAFEGDPEQWRVEVFSTARRSARTAQRLDRRRQRSPGPEPPRLRFAPSDSLQAAETSMAISVLGSLPPRLAEPVALLACAGLTDAQLALVTRSRVRTVRRRLLAGAAALAVPGSAPHPVAPAELAAVLHGEPPSGDASPQAALVRELVDAMRAAPTLAELSGSGPAHAAFRRAFPRRTLPRPAARGRLRGRLGIAVAGAGLATSATMVAAYAGVLPEQLQQVAHDWISAPDAPAHSPRRSPGRSDSGVPGGTFVGSPRGSRTRTEQASHSTARSSHGHRQPGPHHGTGPAGHEPGPPASNSPVHGAPSRSTAPRPGHSHGTSKPAPKSHGSGSKTAAPPARGRSSSPARGQSR